MADHSKSETLFRAARAFPWLFRPIIGGALKIYPYRKGEPHWTILALKEQLNIRVSRRMQADGLLIETDPFDGPGHTFWKEGLTEPETRRLLAKLLHPEMVVFDVGAYIGQFALLAARLTERLRVFAFEPTPSVFAQLQRNVQLNRCDNVSCENVALSNADGTAQFYFYPNSADQNSLKPLTDDWVNSVEVKLQTIDSFVKQRALKRLDVVKVDVEGNELAALQGAAESLRAFDPALIIEISRHQRSSYGYTGAEIKAFLAQFGIECFRIDDDLRPYQPSEGEIHAGCSHFNILAASRATYSRLLPTPS